MFLKTVMERNQPLVRLGIEWQQNGVILPDTYLLDYDTILENARSIKQAGDANGVQNFFMLKQIGRNPLIARALTDMGYVGAVCVDFREALTMVENQIPLGNVGHLVQIPRAALKKILRAKPVIVTVYTLEKAREISAVCTELGLHQKLMLRVLGEGDMLYSGQYGGFELQELDSAVRAIEAMPTVEVGGVCSFPCFLYDEAAQDILPMPNLRTVQTAAEMLRARGYRDLMLNTPSATCTHSIPMIAAAGGTHGEPGHGLTGTTPYHAGHPDAERLRRLKLRADEIACAGREDVVMIEAGRAAVLHKLAHAAQRGKAHNVRIEIFPDLIQRLEPVKQLHVLYLWQVAGEDLVEVVMRVDKAGIAEHMARVDGLVRLLRQVVADRANESVLGVEVNVLVNGIVVVAGDERADISNEQSRHGVPPC